MKRIVIIGGHGKIARLLASLLVEEGNEVTSVIRKADQRAAIETLGATPLVADIETLDTAAIADLVRGFDAIVWSAGAGGGNPERTYAVDRDAAIRTIDASGLAGVDRFAMVSYFDAKTDHGVDPSQSFFHYAEAKAAADEHLRKSDLSWTILGPSTLTFDAPTGLIDTNASESSTVSRANVALTITAVLANDATIGRTIRFNDGETPIAEAL